MNDNPTPKATRLVIDQGMVRLTNKAPSGEYLRDWQTKLGHKDGTPIRILSEEHFQDLISRAYLAGIA